jgi:hypothetical protein
LETFVRQNCKNSPSGFNSRTTDTKKTAIFWVVTPWRMQTALRFRGIIRPRLQGRKQSNKEEQASSWGLISHSLYHPPGTRGRVVVEGLSYKPEGRGLETRWGEWMSSIYVILQAALGPEVHSASNKNYYQKQKNNVSGE